jgi:UDP-galactopyranose mutase
MWLDHPRALSLVPQRAAPAVVCDLRQPADAGTALLDRADLLLTDGAGGFEASRHLHPRTYLFPHAVDVEHFSQARARRREPLDQAGIPGPRVGFWGTVDDRIDFQLLDALAARMPDVHFVMVGEVSRGGREPMSSRPNLHWLGSRPYADLPGYASGWSAAILPFARSEATRFLSPPQIPEFLAAGRTIVSTPLRDVMHPYGASGLVSVAETLEGFVAALESAFQGQSVQWLTTVDRYLRALSWESAWEGIEHLLNGVILRRDVASSGERREGRLPALIPAAVMH